MSHARARGVSRWRLVALVLLVAVAVLAPATAAQALVPGPILPPIIQPPIIIPPWFLSFLSASQPATITGYVKDGDGNGVKDMTVRIWGETSSTTVPNFQQTAVTKADGSFCISDVIQGTYTMYAEDLSGGPGRYRETNVWHEDFGDGDTRQWVQGGHTKDAGVIVVPRNGIVSGHAMDGANPVAGSTVVAHISDGGVVYYREAVTGPDGSFTIRDAPAGDWSMTFSGSGSEVPIDARPSSGGQNGPVVTESSPTEFTLAEGDDVSLSDAMFHKGDGFNVAGFDMVSGNSYLVANANFSATLISDPSVVYYWGAGDDGWGRVTLPPGYYELVMSDQFGLYEPLDVGTITMSSGVNQAYTDYLTPNAGTFAVTGHITEAGSGANVEGYVTKEYVGGASDWPIWAGKALSNGNGEYMVRLPVDKTADPYLGVPDTYSARLTFADRDLNTHVTKQYTVPGTVAVNHDVALDLGGVISGTVHDEAGNVVEGVQVMARRLQTVPGVGLVWGGEDTWWTRTDAAGHYEIAGLPANTDYKVLFTTYFDYGLPLDEKYEVYYRRVYKGLPLVDSLVDSATPVTGVPDHTSVAVALGATKANIDETITPGGYVAVHANGPDNPTGAVWCDVMYKVGTKWIEIDSGFTTGGTFQKLWKVLPVGDYRLDYSDYFGRGSGTWTFKLNENETKWGSILVPAPVTYVSAAPSVKGTFAGLINDGLNLGGTGGANLNVNALPSMPPTAPPLPSGMMPLPGGIFDFTLTGATSSGTWTLTLPYDASVPDNLVGNLRVRHVKQDGSSEILVPFTWNTSAHTLQVQTTSLSPFQVLYAKGKPSLGKPVAPSTAKRSKSFSVYGSLSPRHTAGGKSVQVKIYKLVNHKWKLTSTVWTKNYNYSSYTRYKVSLKLKAGSYRLYAYAPADTWHLATTSSYKLVKVK